MHYPLQNQIVTNKNVTISFKQKVYELFIYCIIPVFLLVSYRSFTWIIPQYLNPLQIKIGWWQIVPYISIDSERIWSRDIFYNSKILMVGYGSYELYFFYVSVIIYILCGKKFFKYYLVSAFCIFTTHLLIYIIFPCYAYVIDPDFVNGSTNIKDYLWSSWNWSALPSYHNTVSMLMFLPFLIYLITAIKHERKISILKFLYAILAFSILIGVTLIKVYIFDNNPTYFVIMNNNFTLGSLISVAGQLSLLLLSIIYLLLENRFNNKNTYASLFYLVYIIGVILSLSFYLSIYIGSIISKRHYALDGIASIFICCLWFIIIDKLLFAKNLHVPIYNKLMNIVFYNKKAKYYKLVLYIALSFSWILLAQMCCMTVEQNIRAEYLKTINKVIISPLLNI